MAECKLEKKKSHSAINKIKPDADKNYIVDAMKGDTKRLGYKPVIRETGSLRKPLNAEQTDNIVGELFSAYSVLVDDNSMKGARASHFFP